MHASPSSPARLRADSPRAGKRALAGRKAALSPLWLVSVAVAGVGSASYLILAPHSVDLAAHLFRAQLFATRGFQIYNLQWYGGHHMPGYSMLFPPLAAIAGPQVVGAVAAVWQAAVFEPLARFHLGAKARWAVLWFAAGTATPLFTGRLVFALGIALALSSLLALQRQRRITATTLSVAAVLASPVAGAFLAVAGATLFLNRSGSYRALGAVVCAVSIATIVAVSAAFSEGGYQPFALRDFALLACFYVLVLLLVWRKEPWVRLGAILCLVQSAAAVAVPNALGGNVLRFVPLVAGPALLACFSRDLPSRKQVLALAALLLVAFGWEFGSATSELVQAKTDPSAQASFYAPLISYLSANDQTHERVEVVFTTSHWEASTVAPKFPLARGWERQLDTSRNHIFYDGSLNPATYGRWLSENGVRYVAVPDAPIDYSAVAERAIIESHPPYLAERWRGPGWRVFEVTSAHPLVVSESASATLTSYDQSSLGLDFSSPGSALVRVRFTPYWLASPACVQAKDGWTEVTSDHAGPVSLRVAFSPDRVFATAPRCDHS